MSTTQSNKLDCVPSNKLGTVLKICLHAFVYMLLGLVLASILNQTVHAAELDCPPPYGYNTYGTDEQNGNIYNEETDNDILNGNGNNGLYPPQNGNDNGNGNNNTYPNNGYDNGNGYPPDLPLPPTPTGWLLVTAMADYTGHRLPGVMFEIRRALGDELVAIATTDLFGEVSIELPAGNYFLRAVAVPAGFILDRTRINFTIHENMLTEVPVWVLPIPAEQPPNLPNEPPALGRLLITSRAHGTGALLQGAVFELRNAMDDVFVAQLVTNQFGEAAIHLPVGDFFLRELTPPAGHIPNTNRVSVRIQADRLTEINITHRPIEPEAEPTPTPEPEVAADGRLLIINREQAQGRQQGAAISGTLFEVRSTMDDRLVAQLRTDQFGEAAVNLPAGDYFIRQIAPANGFVLDSTRTNIRIVSGQLLTVTIMSTAYEVVEDEEEPAPPADGRLLITLMSGATGERLQGGTITIHNVMTDALIATVTSNVFGEASIFLPAGRYFMRQSSMPQGYLVNLDRIPFTINAGDITDMALAVRAVPVPPPDPTPPPAPPTQQAPNFAPATPPAIIETIPEPTAQSRIEIVTRAAGSGNPLSGGLFAVYRAYDNRRIAELTTGADGRAYVLVEPGMHFVRELRPSFGFLLELERIFLEVGVGETVSMELTKIRDYSIAYLPMDVEGGGIIYIPQTGQYWPTWFYIGGGVMLLISFVAGGFLLFTLIKVRGRD